MNHKQGFAVSECVTDTDKWISVSGIKYLWWSVQKNVVVNQGSAWVTMCSLEFSFFKIDVQWFKVVDLAGGLCLLW